MPPALAVFVKTPGLSPVKTRLAQGIGTAAAVRFHQLAARATAEVVSACGNLIRPYWAVAEDEPRAYANWTSFPCIAQGDGPLGERLGRVHAGLQEKHGLVLMIGTDIPQITPALLRAAVDTLSRHHVDHVLGPASDGGFWLFGSKRVIARDTWRKVPYSTPGTAEALRLELAGSGHLEYLPSLTDIDTAADLGDLYRALSGPGKRTPAQRELLAWVHELLRS